MKKEIKSLTNISESSQIIAGVEVKKWDSIETRYWKQLLRMYPKYWKITEAKKEEKKEEKIEEKKAEKKSAKKSK